jgi:hypothetical protein
MSSHQGYVPKRALTEITIRPRKKKNLLLDDKLDITIYLFPTWTQNHATFPRSHDIACTTPVLQLRAYDAETGGILMIIALGRDPRSAN